MAYKEKLYYLSYHQELCNLFHILSYSSSHKRGFSDDFRNVFTIRDSILEETEDENITTEPSKTIFSSESENNERDRKESIYNESHLGNQKSSPELLKEKIVFDR